MLAIADQIVGPNGLTFFEGTHGCPGSNKGFKKLDFFSPKIQVFFSPKIQVFF